MPPAGSFSGNDRRSSPKQTQKGGLSFRQSKQTQKREEKKRETGQLSGELTGSLGRLGVSVSYFKEEEILFSRPNNDEAIL